MILHEITPDLPGEGFVILMSVAGWLYLPVALYRRRKHGADYHVPPLPFWRIGAMMFLAAAVWYLTLASRMNEENLGRFNEMALWSGFPFAVLLHTTMGLDDKLAFFFGDILAWTGIAIVLWRLYILIRSAAPDPV